MYLAILKARKLTETIRAASLLRVQSVRFDKNESPDHVNEGKGWREQDAAAWVRDHGLAGEMVFDDSYIRLRSRPGEKVTDVREVAVGVSVIRCAG